MVDCKQIFFDFKLNFNLCKSKSERPTLIYAVVYFRRKQYKINTGVKVYPSQWNKKKQLAIISARHTKLDNYNNNIVNDKLKQILLSFEQSKVYLCEHIELITNLYELLKQYINPNMASKKVNQNSISATVQMQLLLSGMDEHSRKIYHGCLNVFKRFLDKEGIPDIWSNITGENIEKYKEYLIAENKAIATINNNLNNLKTALRRAHKAKDINFDFYTSGCDNIEKVQDKRSKEEKKSKQIPLTGEQVEKLYNLKLSGLDEEVRDVFVAQCLLGQRISDMPKLFAGDYKKNQDHAVEITVQKTQEQAIIYLFPVAEKIFNKYKVNGFRHLKINKEDVDSQDATRKMNARIKKICKNAGFDEEITYTEHRGSKKTIIKKKLYELIHTHVARHTFITLMCKMGIPKETVIIATAHEDTKMIDEVYLHVSSHDKAMQLSEAIETNARKGIFTAHKRQEEPKKDSPETAIVEVNDLDTLLEKLFKENDLLNLQQLAQNKVDILVLDKTNEVKKYLEDISRIKDYNQQVLQLFNDDSYKMKERLIEILRSVMLLDPTHNTLKIVITTLQQLGLNCQYYNDTYKYKRKAAREAYILVIDMPNGKTVIQ